MATLVKIDSAPQSRRLATLTIRDNMLVDLLRCSGSPAATPEGILQFVHTADLPKDLKVLFAQWDFVSKSVVLVCESASFAEVTGGGTLTDLPSCQPIYRRYEASLKDLAQRFAERSAGKDAAKEEQHAGAGSGI